MVRSNEDMGKDYIIELTPPTAEEIRNARPLVRVLPQDALTHAMLIAVPYVCVQKMMIAPCRKADLVPTEPWGDRSQNCLHDVRIIGNT